MKKLNGLVIVFCTIASLLGAENVGTTCGRGNGRFWRLLNLDGKAAYVIAVQETARECEYGIQDKRLKVFLDHILSSKNATNGELVDKIDAIYDEPLNRVIPILEVYMLLTRQFNGEFKNDQDFNEQLARIHVRMQKNTCEPYNK